MDTSSNDSEGSSTPLLAQYPSPDEEEFDEDDAFAVIARATPSPESVPWEQRSQTMKIIHYVDRIFLCFLAVFLLVLCGEVTYNLYHTVPWAVVSKTLRDWLLMQEESEEDLDL